MACSLGATTTSDPDSPTLTHALLSYTDSIKRGAKARKALARDGIHPVGLGWLLESLAQRRRLGEGEAEARPGTLAGVPTAVKLEQVVDEIDDDEDAEAREVEGLLVRRRAGRGRVAPDVKVKTELEVESEVDVKPKIKRERPETDDEVEDTKTVVKPESEEDEDAKPAPATATNTNTAPHPAFTESHGPGYHVYEHQGRLCSAILNQANLGMNANKFYVLQVIASDADMGPPHFFTFFHWGRNGEPGQRSSRGRFHRSREAVDLFVKKFGAKTSADWAFKIDAEEHTLRKYTLIQTVYRPPTPLVPDVRPTKRIKTDNKPDLPCTLSTPLQELTHIMFPSNMVNRVVIQPDFDPALLPLGRLSDFAMAQGLTALRSMARLIDMRDAAEAHARGRRVKPVRGEAPFLPEIHRLCGIYYTVIPHVCGRRALPAIDTREALDREFELMRTIAALDDEPLVAPARAGPHVHPLDEQYASLQTTLSPLAHDSPAHDVLAKMLAIKTEGERGLWRLELVDASAVAEGDVKPVVRGGERKMLWYGAQAAHWAELVTRGIGKAEVGPRSGSLFPGGISLASLPTKPASACYAQVSGGFGLLALCEVDLGRTPVTKVSKAAPRAEGHASLTGRVATHAVGRIQPAGWADACVLTPELAGASVAAFDRPAALDQRVKTELLHDEWVVYDEERVRIRYLCRVRFVDA